MIYRGNYFDVQAYLDYQEKLLQYSPKTIDRKWAHLRHLLNWADKNPFPTAHQIDETFPKYLLTARNDNQDKRLSPASMQRACLEARGLFEWAKMHMGIKYRRLPEPWIETIRPARASGVQSELHEREYYSLEEIRKLVSFGPERLIDERDRAAAAFVYLSGMRVSAFVSLPVGCVDIENREVDQLPSEGVKTKNSKAARTYLLPLDDLVEIANTWHKRVKKELGEDSLWYPVLSSDGTEWATETDIGSTESRRMSFSRGLKRLCKKAKLVYKSPHKLRNGHGVFGVKAARTIEEFKAFSQNMMHESMGITDRLYGRLAGDDVRNAISGLRQDEADEKTTEELFIQFSQFLKWRQNNG